MKRSLVISHVAAALLLGGSIGAIHWATEDASMTRSPRPVDPATRSAPSSDVADAPASTTPSPASGSTLTPLVELIPAAPVPPGPPDVHRAVPAALPPAVQRARRNFRVEMQDGLAALQEEVARRCSASDTSFVLDLESVDGGIKILDATLESQGHASDKAVSCAQQALRGHVIESPSAEPGRQWKLPFAIVGS